MAGKFAAPPSSGQVDDRVTDSGLESAADEAVKARIQAELDFSDPNSILYFGAKTQRELARISDRMLRLAAAEAIGGAAGDMDQMLVLIRSFSPQPARPTPWWRKLIGGSKADALVAHVGELLQQMDLAAARLERRKTALLTDSVTMDRLQAACQGLYHDLGLYEAAARKALAQAPEALRGELLARCEDLAISRQVAQQSLAAMAVSQRTTRDLLSRVNAVLDHTLVLWKQHMTQVLAIWKGRETARAISDLGASGQALGEMSKALAAARENLSRELARGHVDIEAVTVANRELSAQLEMGANAAQQAREAAQSAGKLLGAES